jgi:hypothetical protein
MTPGWTAFSTNRALQVFLGLLLLLFVALVPSGAVCKGGTNFHELRDAQANHPPQPNEGFGGCGRGRYRDPRTNKCRGPADFGN